MINKFNIENVVFECEEFKKAYIASIKSIFEKHSNTSDVVLDIDGEEFDYEDMLSINFFEDSMVISKDEEHLCKKILIHDLSDTNIYLSAFKSDFGYMSDEYKGPCILNQHLLFLDNLIDDSNLINNLEFFHERVYLQRIEIKEHENKPKLLLLDFNVAPIKSIKEIGILFEPSFLFSYKLLQEGHDSPVEYDNFFVIYGEDLELETCRKACRSFIFEVNTLLDIEIYPSPKETHVEALEYVDNFDKTPTRELIVCEDTDHVIQLYNKALFTDEDELKVLFFTKVIEYISETVIRNEITEIGRKALSSRRALNPDASFIKELQELFNNNSFRKDSEAIKLTVQKCAYISDVESVVPPFLKNKFDKHLQKSEQEALGYLASCISATRNSIAHSKANYRKTGLEFDEKHYPELIELLKVIAQNCVRWFSTQSPASRIVA